MDKQYLVKLLQKYESGEITGEEKQFLEAYYKLFNNEPDELQSLSANEKAKLSETMLGDIWNDISRVEHPAPVVWFRQRRFLTGAAAVFILLFGTVGIYHFSSKKHSAVKNTGATAAQQNQNEHAAVIAPTHQKENRILFLPDGSKVILSAGSKLNYPSSFDDMKTREVFLDGEAFFDIRHNANKSFVVHTGNVETIVLGTAFNIKAKPGEKNIVVTVKRGKVKVSDNHKVLGIITPNQRITYDKQTVISEVSVIKDESYLDWQDKDLFIDNLTISEAAQMIEDRYKVKIIINDAEVESLRFTTTFSKNEALEQTLNSICLFNGLTYQYDKKKALVTIVRNP
ncbi:MAG: FecR domain-containing protein [Chitinophagaceae bacterium]|nr:FecR domain-containing protein [Chitinophagaceae bacterium]